MSRRVAIVGGGVSGLAAAFRILKSGSPVEVALFEADGRLGGIIQTDRSQGVVLEGGPDSFLRRKPEAIQLSEELGLGSDLMGTNPDVRGSYIFHRGHFHDIPEGVQAGIPTRLDTLWGTELLSMGEKMRLWADLLLPRQHIGSDMALGHLLRHRFGPGYVDRVAAPMLAGIYAGDIDKLSTAVTAPQLISYQRRGRSLIREAQSQAALTPAVQGESSPPSMFASLVHGVGSLIDALFDAVSSKAEIHLRTAVRAIDHDGHLYRLTLQDGSTWEASDVVVAVPAYQAARILTFWEESARALLAEIPYADLAVIGAVYQPAAFNRELKKTGFLVPKGEGVAMTAGTWVRAKWNYPDAASVVPIRAFYGRAGDADLLARSDQEFLARFRQEMGYIMGVTDVPSYARVFRIPGGMPQYLVGHKDRVDRIRQEVRRWPGLALIGPYFDGVGVPDCIRHANEAASQLMARWPATVLVPH